jgi:hypothetical protein
MTPIEAYVPPPQAERAESAPESVAAQAAPVIHERAPTDRPARSRNRGGRSRGGSAEPRHEAPLPVEQATRAEVVERARPTERPERQDRAERPAQQRSEGRRGPPERAAERNAERGGDRNRGREEREDRADRDVVGFGSELPAFLMGAPKRPTKD